MIRRTALKFAFTRLLLFAATACAAAKAPSSAAPDVPNPLANHVKRLPAVTVVRAPLVPYNLSVLCGPHFGEAHLYLHRPFGNPALGVIWCEPGHAGDEIIGVNGQRVVAAQYRHWIQVLDSGASPMRLTLRSKYDVVAAFETSSIEPGDPNHPWAPPPPGPRWHPPEASPRPSGRSMSQREP